MNMLRTLLHTTHAMDLFAYHRTHYLRWNLMHITDLSAYYASYSITRISSHTMHLTAYPGSHYILLILRHITDLVTCYSSYCIRGIALLTVDLNACHGSQWMLLILLPTTNCNYISWTLLHIMNLNVYCGSYYNTFATYSHHGSYYR